MISVSQWISFNAQWAKGQHQGLRFGQAFINAFHEDIKDKLPDPVLFHEEDTKEACLRAAAYYVDYSRQDAWQTSEVDPELEATIKRNLAKLRDTQ